MILNLMYLGDNPYPDPGETISLVVTVANYGNTLSSVSEISTNHEGITITDGSTVFGAVATNELSDNTNDPFIIDISENVELGMAFLISHLLLMETKL